MKYIFFGTPRFAATVLEKLVAADLPPLAVVCNQDKPVGRKKIITPPPVKKLVIDDALKIKVMQPVKIDAGTIEEIKSLGADFYIVAAYGKILPADLLKITPMGVIGVHPSLLPKFRGPSPIQTAILEGAGETGVTLFLLDDKVDHGPVIARSKSVLTETKPYPELEHELAEVAGDLLVNTLHKFTKGEITLEAQNENAATYTKKIETEDAYINPGDLEVAESGEDFETAEKILRKILALNPEPGTYTIRGGVRTKLLAAKIVDSRLKPTTIQDAGKKPRFLT